MQIGVVGKPNVGKSTFFSAATLTDVGMANYPFTTIEPNKGMGFVRVECAEKHFGVKCDPRTGFCHQGTRFVPVELVDVAGLVPGAHEGKGLGNKFLDDLRKADALIHVIDASGSTNEKGEPVPPGSYDPAEDIKFLEREIDLWFYGILKKNWQKFGRVPFTSKKHFIETLSQSLSGLGIGEKHLEEALGKTGLAEKKAGDWGDADLERFATQIRRSSKPIVIAANKMDLPEAGENIERLKKEFPEEMIVPCSAIAEYTLRKAAKADFIEYYPGDKGFKALKGMSEKQEAGLEKIKREVLEKYGATGVQEVIEKAVFERLGYIAVFPGGEKKLADAEGNVLPDCFLLPKGSTALDFAFKLHTDIGQGFIKAVDVKKKLLIGKDHELQDGDVVEIVFKK